MGFTISRFHILMLQLTLIQPNDRHVSDRSQERINTVLVPFTVNDPEFWLLGGGTSVPKTELPTVLEANMEFEVTLVPVGLVAPLLYRLNYSYYAPPKKMWLFHTLVEMQKGSHKRKPLIY